MPVGLGRVAWGMLVSYNMDCNCQLSLNALNYNLVPPYKKASISNIFHLPWITLQCVCPSLAFLTRENVMFTAFLPTGASVLND